MCIRDRYQRRVHGEIKEMRRKDIVLLIASAALVAFAIAFAYYTSTGASSQVQLRAHKTETKQDLKTLHRQKKSHKADPAPAGSVDGAAVQPKPQEQAAAAEQKATNDGNLLRTNYLESGELISRIENTNAGNIDDLRGNHIQYLIDDRND
eukprot:TRINITY_DN1121_c0_g1_i3.p3 TRINITY_DN1121_c0_g1~~TRINITY_DN1121_c0_g1_i3.p3  ORF type:complete len:151 (-),score=48.74 TRINITY_DN1121_c0_g1_i3:135-587(-)